MPRLHIGSLLVLGHGDDGMANDLDRTCQLFTHPNGQTAPGFVDPHPKRPITLRHTAAPHPIPTFSRSHHAWCESTAGSAASRSSNCLGGAEAASAPGPPRHRVVSPVPEVSDLRSRFESTDLAAK